MYINSNIDRPLHQTPYKFVCSKSARANCHGGITTIVFEGSMTEKIELKYEIKKTTVFLLFQK